MKVFVYDLGQPAQSWDTVLMPIRMHENSIRIDLTELVKRGDKSYRSLYQSVENLCDGIEGPLELCGFALGGILALDYAIRHKERVKSLVLIAVQYQMPNRLQQFQNVIFRFMPAPLFDSLGLSKAEFIRLCQSMLELDFSSKLPSLAVPTLVICGEKDAENKRASLELARHIPNAQIQVLAGIGYDVIFEAPKKMSEVLGTFYGSRGRY